jgi:hypothetical protein
MRAATERERARRAAAEEAAPQDESAPEMPQAEEAREPEGGRDDEASVKHDELPIYRWLDR